MGWDGFSELRAEENQEESEADGAKAKGNEKEGS